jgi:integrase/recombinase XerD
MKLAQVVTNYVALKRATGLRYRTAAAILKAFARAAGPINIRDIGRDTVLAFLNGSGPIRSSWHLKHYTLAGLFRFAIQRRLVSKSPLPALAPKRPAYAKPYIYSADELRRMLGATSVLDERHPKGHNLPTIPALTFRTVLLLLYGAGLRISEALALTVDDVDLSACTLLVRGTKFFKTRLLPIGPKLSSELGQCAIHRLGLVTRSFSGSAFFLDRRGMAVTRATAERYFRTIRGRVGIKRGDNAYFQPRLHDLRHTFAVHRLVAWYRQGADVQRLLPQLSTYLGHIGLAETQAYLTMTPDLLCEAGRRFEGYAHLEVQP